MITDQFIHIHVPKTGGQFIRGLIHEQKSRWKLFLEASHNTLERSIELLNDNGYKKVPSFAFVRNPWEWYVSMFFFRQKLIENGTEKQYIMLERTGNDVNGFRKYMDLLKRMVCDGENHVVDQKGGIIWGRTYTHLTLSDWHDTLVCSGVDHIGRMETFASDLGVILNKVAPLVFNKGVVIQRANGSKPNASKHEHYRKYYTDELIEVVSLMDKKYIEEFGYSF
jgi:hypothetical protein